MKLIGEVGKNPQKRLVSEKAVILGLSARLGEGGRNKIYRSGTEKWDKKKGKL